MFDTIKELVEKISLGEDSAIELKSVRFRGDHIALSRDDIADEIAAFANTSDSVIVFGVDEKTRNIEGIPRDKLEFLLMTTRLPKVNILRLSFSQVLIPFTVCYAEPKFHLIILQPSLCMPFCESYSGSLNSRFLLAVSGHNVRIAVRIVQNKATLQFAANCNYLYQRCLTHLQLRHIA